MASEQKESYQLNFELLYFWSFTVMKVGKFKEPLYFQPGCVRVAYVRRKAFQ